MIWQAKLITFSLIVVAVVDLSGATSSRDRNDRPFRVVCFHSGSSYYRLGNGKFTVEDIDPRLCTHLIYGPTGIHNNQIRSLDGYLDQEDNYGLGNYRKIVRLRRVNPKLTTMLSVGGKSEGSIKFSEMAKDSRKRKTFVDSCVTMLDRYDFDGLDVNWQHPAHGGGVPEDKDNFVTLLQDLRTAFDPKSYVLSVSVSAVKNIIDSAFQVDKISSIVDFMNVLAFDYKSSDQKLTGLSSPLLAGTQGETELNADFSMKYWLNKGASSGKLVLGISCYGQSWTLANPGAGQQIPGMIASGPGESWTYTRQTGTFGYNEFCEAQKEVEWSKTWMGTEKAVTATRGDQWLSYDDPNTVTEKSKYVVEHAMGGVLLYGIESDDSKGICSRQLFPMLTAAYEILHGETRPPTPSPTTPPTTPSTETDDFKCTSKGFFRMPSDCTRYYQCFQAGLDGRLSKIIFSCGDGTVFDQKKGVCNWKHNVPECA